MAPGRARTGPAYWEVGWVAGQGLRWDWRQAHPGVGADSWEAFKQIPLGCPVGGGYRGSKTIPAGDPTLHTMLTR